MDKLIKFVKLLKEKDNLLTEIDRQCTEGDMDAGEGLDEMIVISKQYDQKLKDLLNEPVKVSKKQFMLDRAFEGRNIN